MHRFRRLSGQGLVEFALVLPALLLIVLSIIEGAFLFQAYLAIQHAAREGARYAVTYQPPFEHSVEQGKDLIEGTEVSNPACAGETIREWYDRRIELIKLRAYDQAMGIRIVQRGLDIASFDAHNNEPGFFGVDVYGDNGYGTYERDHPGLQGRGVVVQVLYNWVPVDPIISAIVPNGVPLRAQAEMINEGFQTGASLQAPPVFAPTPTLPAPTPINTSGPSTPEVEPTPTWTPTSTPPPPTATPTGAYVSLTDAGGLEKFSWLLEELPMAFVDLQQHPDPGPYRVYWTDNCGSRIYLNIELPVSAGTARANLPNPAALPGDSYLCQPLEEGQTYQAWISTCNATMTNCDVGTNDTAKKQIAVVVPVKLPDLIVTGIKVPRPVVAGQPAVMEVGVQNIGTKAVTDTFDIDIYGDPVYTPILKGQPGLIASGIGTAKQWSDDDIAPGQTITLNFDITFGLGGEHTLWAQADTGAHIDEENDDNNIMGPVALVADCSDRCDDFDSTSLDPKWQLSTIGSGTGEAGSASVTASGEARIDGLGSSLWSPTDGRFYLLNQGTYSEDFDMSVKVTDFPRNENGSMAGLMVRESTSPGARYAAIGVVNVAGWPHFQAVVRSADGVDPVDPCGGTSAISAFGDGVWVRIVREGDQFTLYTSLDGSNWNTSECMGASIPGFATGAIPGIFSAPLPYLTRAHTGWTSPLADAVDTGGDGDGFELDAVGAYSDAGDVGGYAQSIDNGTDGDDMNHTDRHRYYNYGFNIPAGAQILGIEVRLDWWLDDTLGTNRMRVDLSWDGGTSWTAAQTDSWERTAEEISNLGSDGDTWGHVWSTEDLDPSRFRLRVSTYSSDVDRDFYLDWIPVRVTYVAAADNTPDAAEFDAFQLCPVSPIPVYPRPRPPLLRECGNVLSNADFVGGALAPWVDGTEDAAVVANGTYSCDLNGQFNYGFSMMFRCDRLPYAPYYTPFHPWAYQEFTVPTFISTTEPVTVEMRTSLFWGVPELDPLPATYPYTRTYGRADDKLQVRVNEASGLALTLPAVVAAGNVGPSQQEQFRPWTADLVPLFMSGDALVNHIGETLRLQIEAPNLDGNGDGREDGDSLFFIDQVRCDICITIQPPAYITETVRRVGGDLRVLLEGIAQPMAGVDVWAIQVLEEGASPPDMGFHSTYSIHDSTYSFYNLSPGRYRIYAQVWVSGVLYTASREVDVDSLWVGQDLLDVDLTLQ